ncbi:MAG: HlyD family type I secretion periplasmic adaptor subunit [Pseudomonadota bacterium]
MTGKALLAKANLQYTPPGSSHDGLGPKVRKAKIWAFSVILAFFGGLVFWSVAFPISSAAIATGVVSPEGNRRTVQHLEGGIIKQIHVAEGAVVQPGDLLISLDETRAQASHDVLRVQRHTLTAIRSRLLTERRFLADPSAMETYRQDPESFQIAFPAWLDGDMASTPLAELKQSQVHLFEGRVAVMLSKAAIASKEIEQLNEKIRGIEIEISSMRAENTMIDEQLTGLLSLEEKGFAPKDKIIGLQREQIRLKGDIGERRTEIAEAKLQIAKIERGIITDREQYLDAVNQELSSTRTLLADVETQLLAAEDKLARTEIRAPHAGIVMDLQFTSDRGVIGRGQPILDIVPEEAELLIDARVSPSDIDNINIGQRARVVFPAFGRRDQGLIYGEVTYVSADRLTDAETGKSYFLARIKVDPDTLTQRDKTFALRPGLNAEVFIMTGKKTALAYLLDPFIRSIDHSFREG